MRKKDNASAKSPDQATDEAMESLLADLPENPGGDAASLRQQLEQAEKKALMYQADLENFRRRKNRETEDLLKYASEKLIGELLGVMDNLERALEAAKQSPAERETLLQGVEMVYAQLRSVFDNAGCRRIEAAGQEFDPNLHEAISKQPSEQPANTVIGEVQPGYRLHDRVIRPARVIISSGPADARGEQ